MLGVVEVDGVQVLPVQTWLLVLTLLDMGGEQVLQGTLLVDGGGVQALHVVQELPVDAGGEQVLLLPVQE